MARSRVSHHKPSISQSNKDGAEPFFGKVPDRGNRAAPKPFFQAKSFENAPAAEGGTTEGSAPEAATGTGPEAQPAAGAGAAAPPAGAASRLIVDDDGAPSALQMRKTEFLSLLKERTYESVNEVLVGSPFASNVSAYMQTAVAGYQSKTAAQLEGSLMKQVPAAGGAQTAMQLIDFVRQKAVSEVRSRVPGAGVVQDVAQTVGDIAQSVTNVVSDAGSAISNALSSVGDLLFKENTGGAHASASPATVVQQLGKGQSLDTSSQIKMESAFGTSFSDVEMHTDSKAAQLSGNMNARAFTVGNHIAFGNGEHSPGTLIGDALMAHELAHVVQQRNTGGDDVKDTQDYNSLEAEADGAAAAVLLDGNGTVEGRNKPKGRSGLQIQRCGPSASKATGKDGGAPAAADGGTTPANAQPTAPLAKPGSMNLEVAGANRVKWRVNFESQKKAQDRCLAVRAKNIKADDPEKVDKLWTFYYYPLSEAEAKAKAAEREKSLGDKYKVEVLEDTGLKTFYLKTTLKCPEGVPVKAGFDIWPTCFSNENDAKAQVKKFKDALIDADVFNLDEGAYAVYYRPYKDEASAKAAGEVNAAKRGGYAEGMFQIGASFDASLNSFVSSSTTVCPKGYKEVPGSFLVTSYVLAQESDYPAKPVVKDPPGLKGTFREGFLYQTEKAPRGVKTQGSGISLSGKFIHYNVGKDEFEVLSGPITKSGTTATSGRTVAVDKSVIPLGTQLLIEDVGLRTAEDTGKFITGNHIDVYHGTDLDWKTVLANSLKDKKVCMKV